MDADDLADPLAAVDALLQGGVIEGRDAAGVSFLRFGLDPVAEYLAALDRMDRFGSDASAWRTFLAGLTGHAGYPKQMSGFLVASENCAIAYAVQIDLPDVPFPWLQSNGREAPSPSPSPSDRSAENTLLSGR